MTKPMKYRKLAGMLREAGFDSRQGKGDHEVWSKGPLHVSITRTREVSPGLTAKALKAIREASR